MSFAGTAALIVATSELSVVRLIRGAMRAADLASGKGQSATPLGLDPNPDIEPRRRIEPTPVYEPRRHIQPTPRYEERPVYRTVRYETHYEPVCRDGTTISCPVVAKHPIEGPIPPVWKQLPPIVPPDPPRRPVKVVRHHSDIRHKGIVVDVHA